MSFVGVKHQVNLKLLNSTHNKVGKESDLSNELNVLRACALLHDIGKPECWANKKPWSHHINWTHAILDESFGEKYATIAMRHHTGSSYPDDYHPQTEIEKIISLADNLASGADRREEPKGFTPHPTPPFHLTHVLSNGRIVRNSFDEVQLAYASKVLREKLKEIGKSFVQDSKESYLQTFTMLESSDLPNIPADTRSPINDVSLWDHLKLTTALAACIWLDGGYKGDALSKYEFALISGDADKISRFVNLSARLPDLNARSERIRVATDAVATCVTQLLGPECLIFAAGGGLLGISPVNMAENVVGKVKESFEAATYGLVTITVNSIVSSGVDIQKAFGKMWKDAQWQMRLKKSERAVGMVESLSDEVRACDVCHVRPMSHEDVGKILPYDASPRPERLCEFCWQLRKEGHGVSLDQFKKRSNFAAIIRADGDNIGGVLGGDRFMEFGKAATPSRLSTISRHIHGVCEYTLEKIVRDSYGRCLIAGGDDILAILPGEESLATAGRIAAEFRREMAGACTLSAGVAIFHYDLPIYAGLEAAEELLHIAKETESKDSVAFAIIGSVGLTTDELENSKHGPRKWRDLEQILVLATYMSESGVASSQIRKIASVAKKNPELAEIVIKSLMGKGEKSRGLNWKQGENFLSYLESGILLDAFAVYSAFKV